ncbi:ABC transporter ATP-binding protein [Bordetella genomosp. 10]|uniref:ABC transporter ATP-binding protein n=1 Tax=Bordetella genomosp. 10 TaxID=1416804 RepID=UPI00211AEFC9|nr:ABC transporter ATP-binding protein [Bordetella genomosp. 10]
MTLPLREVLGPCARGLLFAVLLQAAAGISSCLSWVALAKVASAWASPGAAATASWIAMTAGAALLACVSQAFAFHQTHRVDARLVRRLRRLLVDRLSQLPLGWFVQSGPDGVARYVGADVEALHQLVAHAPADLARAVVVPITAFICLAMVDPWLLAWSTVPLACAILVFRRVRAARHRPLFANRAAALEQLLSDYAQLANDPLQTRLFPGVGHEARLRRSIRRFSDAFSQWVRRIGRLGALTDTLLGTPLLTAWIALGAWHAAHGRFDIARLSVFVLLIRAIAAPILSMGHGGDALRAALGAAARLQALFAVPALEPGQSRAAPGDASIVFRRVSYGAEQNAILHGIDLAVEPGSATALVGPSGAGKSTLLMLAARFMDPDQGDILMGGRNIRELPARLLYRHLSILPQHASALEATLAENIALYRPQASLHEIRQAARQACLDDRVMALPDGYDTVYGRDVVLSGGELQRLALARALLSPASVLLLDEPASAVDPATRRALERVLLGERRTRLIVTHDLDLARRADRIAVMSRGRIVEHGSHAQLLQADAAYAALWRQWRLGRHGLDASQAESGYA